MKSNCVTLIFIRCVKFIEREPFNELAKKIFLKTLYYLLQKHLNKKQYNEAIKALLALFTPVQCMLTLMLALHETLVDLKMPQ